jgi:surface antigen
LKPKFARAFLFTPARVHMRAVAMVAFLVAALSASPTAAIAQAPVTRLDSVIATIRVNRQVRVLTRDTVPITFRLATRRTAALDLYETGRELPLNPARIDSLWVSGQASQTTLGAILGGIVGVAFFSSMERMDGGTGRASISVQARGVMIGAALGAVLGSAAASPNDRWRLRYGRPSASEAPPE